MATSCGQLTFKAPADNDVSLFSPLWEQNSRAAAEDEISDQLRARFQNRSASSIA